MSLGNNAVRVGLIGFGNQGSGYARAIVEGSVSGAILTAVADPDPARLEAAEDLDSTVSVFSDRIALMESGSVDAVIVCTPHYEHPQAAIDALTRGLHVLVEKPAGVYTKQVAELNAVAAAHPKLTFAIMFNQRANPLYARLKAIIDAGEIGAIRRSNWIITTWWRPQGYYDLSPWRATWGGEGGGVLVNQAPHQLDLWQWICGVPRSVFSKVGYGFRRDIVVEDEVTVLADYGDGVTGVFVTATHDIVGTDRFEILADGGKIVVENSEVAIVTRLTKPEQQLSDEVAADDILRSISGGLDTAALYTTETIRFESKWGAQHVAVLQNFVANILHGDPLLAPGGEGIDGVRLANAVHLSSWSGREVELDFDDDDFLAALNDRIRAEGIFPERS